MSRPVEPPPQSRLEGKNPGQRDPLQSQVKAILSRIVAVGSPPELPVEWAVAEGTCEVADTPVVRGDDEPGAGVSELAGLTPLQVANFNRALGLRRSCRTPVVTRAVTAPNPRIRAIGVDDISRTSQREAS